MKCLWILFGVVLINEYSLLVLTSPVTNPTVEYMDSPSATEVVFDESVPENMRDETNSDNNDTAGATTELPEDSTQSDDLPKTTNSPCGNDIESLDCNDPLENSIDPRSDEILKTDANANGSDDKENDQGETTVSPPNSKET